MKKMILTLLVALPMSVFAQKFGHFNSTDIIQYMPEFAAAQSKLQAQAKVYEDQLQEMQDELKLKADAYDKEKATMTDTQKQEREKELTATVAVYLSVVMIGFCPDLLLCDKKMKKDLAPCMGDSEFYFRKVWIARWPPYMVYHVPSRLCRIQCCNDVTGFNYPTLYFFYAYRLHIFLVLYCVKRVVTPFLPSDVSKNIFRHANLHIKK